MVERFRREFFEMKPNENGSWVNYSDYAALEAQLAERVSRRRAIAEAIISASNCTGDTLAVDGNHLILVPADGAVTINLLKLAKALSALDATPPAPKVTEAMVTAMIESLEGIAILSRSEARQALTAAQEAGKP